MTSMPSQAFTDAPVILITGSTGMVGTYLLMHAAARKGRILAAYRNPASRRRTESLLRHYGREEVLSRTEWIRMDLTDPCSVDEAVERADAIFHAAAHIGFSPSDKRKIYAANVEGTARLVNAALHRKISYFMHVSSVAALGGNDRPKTEKSVWTWSKPATVYAASKFLGEMEVWRGFEEGLKGAVINPSIIIAPGFYDRGVGKMVRKLHQRKLPVTTSGSNGFVDVRDVAEIMWKLYEKRVHGERFIVNAGHMSFQELAEILARHLKVPPPRFSLPRHVARLLTRLYNPLARITGMKIIDDTVLAALYDTDMYDNSKIVSLLGYRFIPLEESLRNLVEDYLKFSGFESG